MFPFELARYKIVNDEVKPIFATEEDYEAAEWVISFFKEGRKVGDVLEDIKYLAKVYDEKLVKGLAREYLKRCKLDKESPIEPIIIRRELFTGGPALTEEEREKRVNEVKMKLGLDPLRFLYSDLDEERIIVQLPFMTPEELVKLYNMSLLQTLLLKSYRMLVYVKGNWKEIIRNSKYLGLMYFAYDNPIRLEFIGPGALLKMTEKYGRNLAILSKIVVNSPEWVIEADVILGKKKNTYRMRVKKFPLIKAEIEEEDKKRFDSSVEENFYKDFKRIVKDWDLQREPEPLVVGDRLFIPDFVATKRNLKIYIEIVGFWTKEYLENKLEKLKMVNKPMLVLANEELSYQDFSDLNVILYKKKVDIAKVYNWLKEYEAKHLTIEKVEININDNMVSIDELLKRFNVDRASLLKSLENLQNYIKIGNCLIRIDYLEELKKKQFKGQRLSQLTKEYGECIHYVLEHLGYKLKWINISDAVVEK